MALARHSSTTARQKPTSTTSEPRVQFHRHSILLAAMPANSRSSKFKIPQQGAPADAVHQMLKDELKILTGMPNLNLAR
ncbi:MAG: hypothetical protein Q9181_006307 [Wetmoreana brouardii]